MNRFSALVLFSLSQASVHAFTPMQHPSNNARPFKSEIARSMAEPGADIFSLAASTFARHRDSAALEPLRDTLDKESPTFRGQPALYSTFATDARPFAATEARPDLARAPKFQTTGGMPEYSQPVPKKPRLPAASAQQIMSPLGEAVLRTAARAGRLQGKLFGGPKPEDWIN
jgi:hypothetical protein